MIQANFNPRPGVAPMIVHWPLSLNNGFNHSDAFYSKRCWWWQATRWNAATGHEYALPGDLLWPTGPGGLPDCLASAGAERRP